MTAGNNAVKVTAKNALKGNMLKAVISSMIPLFCFFISYYTASVAGLFAGDIFADILFILMSVFLFFPLCVGTLRFFWRLILECDDKPISVFYYFSEKSLYLKSLKLLFHTVIKLLPIAVLLFLPSGIIWLLSQSIIFEKANISIPLWTRNLAYPIIFAKTLAFAILLIVALRYYIAPVLFVADEDIDAAEALHMSSVISRNTSFDFVYLVFSFIGWILLSFFAIPLIYTLPYMIAAYAVHARFAITEYNLHIERLSAENYPSFSVGV